MKTKLLLLSISILFTSQVFSQESDLFASLEIPITQGTTLGDLPIFNTKGFNNIYWYNAANQEEGTKLAASTKPNNNDVSYAYQTIGSCAKSLAVKTILLDGIPAPIYDGEMPVVVCEGDFPTLCDFPISNTEGFYEIYWFDTPDQADGSELECHTIPVEGNIYYAFQGIGDGAEALSVEIFESIPAPVGESFQLIASCEGVTLADLEVYNTVGDAIYWINTESTCDFEYFIDPATIVENGETYYAIQGFNPCCPGVLSVTVSCSIGIDDEINTFFTISPNPTQDFITISFTETLSNPTITIVDALGKTVMDSKLVYENNKAIINLSSYQSGVYSVQIKTEEHSQTQRIIKK